MTVTPARPLDPFTLLLLEDSDLDAELLVETLAAAGMGPAITRVTNRADYVYAIEDGPFDLILADFSLPDFDGATALAVARERAPDTPFIFVSGVLGEEVAIASLKNGATDYVLKQGLSRLPSAVTRALAEAETRRRRHQAEEHMKLLVAELSHRVKNSLATVTSIARLTLQRSRSLPEFEAAFMGRLQALSETHALIFQANWGDTVLREVLERTLQPFRRDLRTGFSFAGEPLTLAPNAALALSLIVHELATNAAKYGALSQEDGRVAIRWHREPGPSRHVRLVWEERGGPPVRPPSRRGFGVTLIERSTRYELEGEAILAFQETGLRCELVFPVG